MRAASLNALHEAAATAADVAEICMQFRMMHPRISWGIESTRHSRAADACRLPLLSEEGIPDREGYIKGCVVFLI